MKKKSKILVIGDGCIDIHTYCQILGTAPDKPVPILKIVEQVQTRGMALNVARNIEALGSKTEILVNKNWNKITKNRFIHDQSNHMFFRLDSTETIKKIELDELKLKYDLIVISDYDKGFLDRDSIAMICKSHHLTFLDTKKELGDWANDATFIKINNFEHTRSLNYIQKSKKQNIIQTSGPKGAFYNQKHFPVPKIEIIDVSGAGDTFLAALVVNYLENEDIEKAIVFANISASKVVQHRGITTV